MDYSSFSLAGAKPEETKKEGKKNVLNRVVGAVPSPIRTVVRGGVDVLDTPRAAVMSAAKEIRDLNNSRGFSFRDLVSQTRSNISAYEALDLQRLGRWGAVAGLGIDLAVGAKTMPGTGFTKAGVKGGRAEKTGAQLLARNAVDRAQLQAIKDIKAGTGPGHAIWDQTSQAVLQGGGMAEDAMRAGTRAALHRTPEVQEAVKVGAKAIVQGTNRLSKAELATLDRARTLTIGRRAIPGSEQVAQKVADTIAAINPLREVAVRGVTKQGYDLVTKNGQVQRQASAVAGRFAQNFDVLGQTGSRLRAAAIEAVDTGDNTRLLAEMSAAAVRSKGLGAGSMAAHDLVEGVAGTATKGLRRNVQDVFGVRKAREAAAQLRQKPDRGVADLLDGLAGPPAPGNRVGLVVRKTLAEVHDLDPQYWAANPERWQTAVGSLAERATKFGDDIAQANQLPRLLAGGKTTLAGQSDVISNVLTPWVESVGKELGASKIADPDALMRLSAANDLSHIAAGGKTIKLGDWGEISEETFKRVTGTFGGSDDIAGFTRHFQGVSNVFKASALASPAFSNRNFIGGVLNNYANGVSITDARWAAKQYARFTSESAATRATTAPEFVQMMARQGDAMGAISRGAEIQPFAGRVVEKLQGMQQALDKTGVSARGVLTGTTGIKAPTEVVLRGAAYKRGLRMGLTEEGAWAFAQKIHIDYQDLSHTDVAARRVAPFWMWASRNPGLQAEYAARGMGFGNALEVSMANAQESQAGDPFPPFIAGGSLALGGGRTLDLSALPSTDLYKPFDSASGLSEVARGYLQQMNPALQAPLELASGVELGTGRPVTRARFAASFFPPLSTAAALVNHTPLSDTVPDDLKSRSQLPGWAGKLGVAGSPFQVRQYSGG